MPIYGFNGVESKVEGTIQLPVTLGRDLKEAIQMLNFLVIKDSSTYNAILGRTGLHVFKAVGSTYDLKVKSPTKNGICGEKRDQNTARSCYIAALRADGVKGKFYLLKTWISVIMMNNGESQHKIWFLFLRSPKTLRKLLLWASHYKNP